MTAWDRPKWNPEAKLLFTDSLAGLMQIFGYQLLEEAVDWLRDRATMFRPAIKDIRDYCEAHRPARSAPQAELEHVAYLRDVKLHPELYVPVDACIAVGEKVTLESKRRKAEGKPMTEGERQGMIRQLTREMNEAWLKQVEKDRLDRKTIAAGA